MSRVYTPEEKEAALAAVERLGSVYAAAQELGIPNSTLARWARRSEEAVALQIHNKRARDEWGPVFIAKLTSSGNVSAAAREAGISRRAAYDRRDDDPAFAAAWSDALEEATDALEEEARRRAVEGTEKPLLYKGEVVGYIQEYSDTLMTLLLKAHRPEKYRERKGVEVSGPGGGPIRQEMSLSEALEILGIEDDDGDAEE